MQESSLEKIRLKALALHAAGQNWHFHILSPTCIFNEQNRYAFILEDITDNQTFVYYSEQAEKTLGQELSPLLHGAKIMDQQTVDSNYQPSAVIQKITQRVKEFNEQGVEWHHHVFFATCRFNEHSPKFVLVVEDPIKGDLLESVSEEEPTNDLKQIEGLFYGKTAPKN